MKCGHKDAVCKVLITSPGNNMTVNNPDAFKDENDIRCLNCDWRGIFHDLI